MSGPVNNTELKQWVEDKTGQVPQLRKDHAKGEGQLQPEKLTNNKQNHKDEKEEARIKKLQAKRIDTLKETFTKTDNGRNQPSQTDDHLIPLTELYKRLNTDPKMGLTDNEVYKRRLRDGPNILVEKESTPQCFLLLKQMFHGFNLLLWVGAALCFIAFGIEMYLGMEKFENLYLGIVLALVVTLTAWFSYFQEYKSGKLMDSFRKMIPQKSLVTRNGQHVTIDAKDLVVGDIVRIKSGDRIPADIRIISHSNCAVDNSNMTGESEAQKRSSVETNENLLEAKNMAFFSTNCVDGTADGVVVQTGNRTVIGIIAYLVIDIQPGPTPIAKELSHFVTIVSVLAGIVGILLFIIAIAMEYSWVDSVVFFIGIIVANVPEGLAPAVIASLTLTAQRMAKNNCLVKRLDAVETLGSTSTICSDKTGTLTQNRMTVTHVWLDEVEFAVNLYSSEQKFFKSETWKIFAKTAILCNNSEFEPGNEHLPLLQRKTTSDATESAILKFLCLVKPDILELRQENPRRAEIAFNSRNKYHVTFHEDQDGDESHDYIVCVKGAPERILEMCSTVMKDGQEKPLDKTIRREFDEAYNDLGGAGERVLGFCYKFLPSSIYPKETDKNILKDIRLEGMRYLGMIAMVDPPRPGVCEAVVKCRSAGIKVVMVTGDHPITAKSIAQNVGIISRNVLIDENFGPELNEYKPIESSKQELRFLAASKAAIVRGSELDMLTDDTLDMIVTNHDEMVFARTSPEQKLRIVESYQRTGAIVAVTGDGVNDSPALKKADIGIAMGITGSDVSRQAADMILMDDNFASIVTGIEEGRIIFDNMKKSIAYVLTSNVPEVAPFICHVVLGIPLPLGIIAILFVDLGTDVLPAISLAYEKPESNLMARQPRNAEVDRLVNPRLLSVAYALVGVVQALGGFFAYFVVMASNGFLPPDLVYLRKRWDSKAINDLPDSYNQEWTYTQRKELEYTCHTCYFVALVMLQIIDLIICKTRSNSILDQGMTNHVLNCASIFVVILSLLLCYIPGLSTIRFYPITVLWWLLSFPFVMIIFFGDELRRYFIRKYPDGFFYREFYY